MFRSVEDFEIEWKKETDNTLRLFERLTPDSLSQQVVHGGRSLGLIAWHLSESVAGFAGKADLELDVPEASSGPNDLAGISIAFRQMSLNLVREVKSEWLDSMLDDEFDFFGNPMKKGYLLSFIILHIAHHRGQMTVLMRQAGLTVPGMYGPSREEWAALGMEVQK